MFSPIPFFTKMFYIFLSHLFTKILCYPSFAHSNCVALLWNVYHKILYYPIVFFYKDSVQWHFFTKILIQLFFNKESLLSPCFHEDSSQSHFFRKNSLQSHFFHEDSELAWFFKRFLTISFSTKIPYYLIFHIENLLSHFPQRLLTISFFMGI